MKQTRDKLESLPKSLRKEADKIIGDKFDEPEVIKKTTNEWAEYSLARRTTRFVYYESPSAIFTPGVDSATTIPYDMPTSNSIDGQSLDTVRGIIMRMYDAYKDAGMSYEPWVAELLFRFHPGGNFQNGADPRTLHMMIGNERLAISVCPGMTAKSIEKRLWDRMKELSSFYGGGYFHCELVRWEIRRDTY